MTQSVLRRYMKAAMRRLPLVGPRLQELDILRLERDASAAERDALHEITDRLAYPPGHYHSPTPSLDDLATAKKQRLSRCRAGFSLLLSRSRYTVDRRHHLER